MKVQVKDSASFKNLNSNVENEYQCRYSTKKINKLEVGLEDNRYDLGRSEKSDFYEWEAIAFLTQMNVLSLSEVQYGNKKYEMTLRHHYFQIHQ